MDSKLRPIHAIGGITAFAAGFVLVSAMSAFAYGEDPVYIPSTPENPTFILSNAVNPQLAKSDSALIPLYAQPDAGASIVQTIPAATPTFVETCTSNDRWCLVRLAGGSTGWVDLVTLIEG